MAFVVEKDKALYPVDIGLFGADGIVLEADDLSHPVEELFGRFFIFASVNLTIKDFLL